MKLPQKFLDRMKMLLGDEFNSFINSYSKQPIKSFFINNNKINDSDFLKNCNWKIKKNYPGWQLMEDIKIGKTVEHHAGMIYMQELSAMMPVTFLPLNENDLVLDMCSAPGGKSIQIANRLKNGFLISNEIIKSRANILESNIERMGLKNVCITNNSPIELEKFFKGIFDAIVVDAPCSGEGMFRKDDNAIANWSSENVQTCADRQLEILESANKMLKNGGYILYSTCTFSVEENEGVVMKFCERHNYNIIKLDYTLASRGVKLNGVNTDYALRFYPHKFDGEGQFVCLMQKNEVSDQYIKLNNRLRNLNEFKSEFNIFKKFCESNLKNYQDLIENCIFNKGIIYYTINKEVAQSGVRLINCGCIVGEIINNRFEPHHNFITCFGNLFKQSIDLNEEQANKFIKGETLDCDLDGFVVVKYKGVVLGFGKSKRVLKNKYPKALRNL